MADRKAPRPRPANQRKPDPPPAPPARYAARVGACTIFTTEPGFICPLCGVEVTPNVEHRCSRQAAGR